MHRQHSRGSSGGKMAKNCELLLGVLLFVCMLCSEAAANESGDKRKGKLFPIFQVVTFPNSACSGSTSKNGTCFTAAECASKGGVASGSCASSYGVCCIFSIGCGQTSSQNCTYFESGAGASAGACSVKICKCNSNICQLRLDFNSFVISGPSSDTTSIGKTLNGVLTNSKASGKSVTATSQCLTDTFTVTNPNGASPPVICGTNTGEHMYVDAADACNTLAFQLGTAGVGTALATRAYSIKVTQYDCNYQNLAPPGCTQYFFGSSSAAVMTFNFQGGLQLANQHQNICVRRERGNCKICWTAVLNTDFQVSGATALVKEKSCCRYGTKGTKTNGGDCLTIPGALRTKQTKTKPGKDRICGSGSGLAAANSANAATVKPVTVCSITQPFNINFLSDSYEFKATEAAKKQKGFKLTYIQSATGC